MSSISKYVNEKDLVALDLLKSDLGFGVVESITKHKTDSDKDQLMIRFSYQNDFGWKDFHKGRMRKEVMLFEKSKIK